MLTQDRLRELFNYDPLTGEFTRISRTRGMRKQVGSLHNRGYWQICVDYKTYLAHRLAWIYMTGESHTQVDHINGDRLDNRFSNLRPATNKQNSENIKLYSNNKSLFRGVHFCNRDQKWVARVVHHQKTHYVGSFTTAEEAAIAAKHKRDELFTHHKTSHAA
jgi:HNH endonuclease/AP2 domain